MLDMIVMHDLSFVTLSCGKLPSEDGYMVVYGYMVLYNFSYDLKSIDKAYKCSLKVFCIKLHSIGKLQFNRL